MHFLWTLPPGDHDYSKRIGRIKVRFTRSCPPGASEALSASRPKHRERAVWQRRFWEHTIDEVGELEAFLDYIHYNPQGTGWLWLAFLRMEHAKPIHTAEQVSTWCSMPTLGCAE